MSGFLQRLASRALGRPPAIRPIVGSYAPALRAEPMPLAETPMEETGFLLPQDAADAERRTATRRAPRVAADPVPSGEPREHEELPAFPRIGKTREASQAEPESHAADGRRDRLQPQRRAAALEAIPLADDRLVPARAHEAAGPLQARLADAPDAVRPPSGGSDSDPEHLRPGGVAPAPAVRASARSPFASQRTRRHSPHMPGAVEHEPENITEVHVTIGRIELTAAPAVASPRRAPVVKRKAQSLEEYLARREANRS